MTSLKERSRTYYLFLYCCETRTIFTVCSTNNVLSKNSRVRYFFFVLISIILIVTLTFSQSVFSKDPSPTYPIQGTFIQLLEDTHGQWSEKEWIDFFSYLKRLRISKLYLQWTVADTRSFFFSTTFQSVKTPPLETILRLAEQFEMKVNIGLIHDYEYWNQITKNSNQIKTYLDNLLNRSKLAAKQITTIAKNYKSFNGWYITEEIDDINWKDDYKKELLFSYLERLSDSLEKLTPSYQIAISGFCNGLIEINEFYKFWNLLLKQTKINFVLFQDGIGTKKLTFYNLPDYLATFKKAAIDNQREIGVIVEIFRQIDGYPINKKNFRAVPANLYRINRQSELASKFSSNIIAFSVPDYMMPIAGNSAKFLYNKYLEKIKE